ELVQVCLVKIKPQGAMPRKVERLFPFVVRARKLLVGRETLARSKSKLQFVLISSDISPGSRDEVLRQFLDYPVVQKYSAAELEGFFGRRNTKVIGFAKSSLAKSIYAELKEFRLNVPVSKVASEQAKSGEATNKEV
ncbi:MAG TPA: hypothetical protein VGR78_13875, partial [Verrucomicrobiae bacterium]|nr:hypothetical protein [Verrucomicrobiae bacterium]